MVELNRRELFKFSAGLAGTLFMTQNALAAKTDTKAVFVPSEKNPLLLNFNENSLGMSDSAKKAVVDCLGGAFRYPDAARAELINTVAKKFGVDGGQVLLGNGSSEVIQAAVVGFAHAAQKAGKAVQLIVPDPTFNYAELYAAAMGVPVKKITLTKEKLALDLNAMKAKAEAFDGVSIVYICNPNNPTATITESKLLSDWFGQKNSNTFFIVDEAYAEFVTDSRFKSAIEDVKRDMESPRVMDRVVCGDVGFGKTEVAIRAAFKAAIEGKQVVVMVPTTVLAQQHYERFTERMKNYPITIELLSRLSSLKEQKTTLDNILSGAVDIVIGTHRILSEDVKFKDLGLVIIDEEQKFGVKAKEHLKRLRNKIDMLTLTATPIPRTLNLALLGIRDLSVIDTPPEGRKPIETIFLEGTDKNIRDAIMREIAREGQVFYIFNSVKGIEKKVYELKGILPEYLKIGFVHGKMLPKEIKERIKEFENGEIDVLLATTIIENGIDIENANTMIIDRADKLGLSQIYQLRGRVGRGNRQSYCYLLTKEYQSKKAKDREDSIKMLEETGGGGLQLSMEDMRIRGAGEILGEKQHGALETFGYTLYMKMLQEEIEKIKGEFEEDLEDIEIKVNYPAFIPESYIKKSEKIKIYRRVADIKRESELQEIKDELIDRFGKMPIEAQGFFKYIALKFRARKLGVKRAIEIKGKNESDIKFHNDKMNFEKLLDLIQKEIIRYQKKEDIIEYDGTIEEFLNVYEQ